jgi:threonine/homoserine/homoserine lactone efflux protein
MNLQLYLAFCVTIAILIAVPGPIVSMIVANALSDGAGAGVTTAVGAGIGNAILLGAAAAGIGVSVARRLHDRITGSVLIGVGVAILLAPRGG